MNQREPRNATFWAAAAVVVLVLSTYSTALQVPFHFDDRLFLEDDNIRLGRWQELFRPPTGRPLSWLTFLLQYQLHGPDPRFFHAFNLLIHALNGLLVLLLFQTVARLRQQAFSREAAFAAFWGALIFALHPLQTESVLYVYQRSTLLAAGGSLAALILYLRGRTVAAFLAFLGAAACKETAVVVPFAFYLSDLLFKGRRRPSRTVLAAWAAALLAGAAALFGNVGARAGDWSDIPSYAAAQVSMIWRYLRLALFPVKLNVDWHVVPSSFLWTAEWWVDLAALAGLLALAICLSRRHPAAAFYALLFFLFLAPSSSLVPTQDYLVEHRMYASVAAWSGLLSLLVSRLLRVRPRSYRPGWAAVLAVLALLPGAYTAKTVLRSEVWKSEEALWRDAAAKSPGKYRPNYNLGVLLMDSSPAEAIYYLSRAVRIEPLLPLSYRSLGQIYFELEQPERSLEHWSQALALNPADWEAHLASGQIHLIRRRYNQAQERLRAAQELQPGDWRSYYYLGQLYLQLGLSAEAVREAEAGLQLDWRNARLRFLLADAVFQTGDWSRAAELYLEGLQQEPDAWAYFNLARAYQAGGQSEKALEAARRGVAAANAPGQREYGLRLLDQLSAPPPAATPNLP